MSPAEVAVTIAGLLAIGALAWFFFAPRPAATAALRSGLQEVEVTVKGGYSPDLIRLRQGVPARLVFHRQESSDCTARVVFPDLRLSRSLPPFQRTAVEFVPERSGEFPFACGMNMVHGALVVEPADLEPTPASAEREAPDTAAAVGVGPVREVDGVRETVFSLHVDGITSATGTAELESRLGRLRGVDRVEVNLGAERVTVAYDEEQVCSGELEAAVAAAGYSVEQLPADAPGEGEDAEAAARRAEIRDLSGRVVLGAILTTPVLLAVMASDVFDAG